VGGNIGKPLLPEIENITKDDFVVIELSSFQLISMRKSPDIAVVTNVAPNHLDVHKDMDEYVEAKKNVILHQNAFSRTVLNADNEITKSFKPFVRGQSLSFSMETPLKNGAWLDENGVIHMSYRGIDAPIMSRQEIAILGDHNVENYLTAITAVWGYVGADSIRKVAREFKGVEHRIEFVKEVNGVKYYNDSIASSPTRTIACLKAFEQKIWVIAGGYDKHIPYEPMVPYVLQKVEKLLLCGATAEKIKKAVLSDKNYNGTPEILEFSDIAEAVAYAHQNAKSGDVVALSPASASFDKFPNFVARGNYFKELVNKL
jgi:UDP-N-acetylmuramoylalanine--D-glutamate ligase